MIMTTTSPKKPAALGLTSGGLDSMLAAIVLQQQDIRVEWLCLETPFFSADKSRQAAEQLGIPITVRDITAEYLPMLKNPPCGYGQHMNPCLDCHGLMANIAGRIMAEQGFDFIFSGEVVGQRPMSQTKPSLRYVEKQSGIEGYLLRPLSARLLPETIPEQTGLVDRDRLLDFSGRSRKAQMTLAEEHHLRDYPSPGGGCLLTDKSFSLRLRDLFDHQEDCGRGDLALLRYGRHFRLSEKTRLIVGRTREDNQQLEDHAPTGPVLYLKTRDYPGPTCLLIGQPNEGEIMLAAGICVGYGKAPDDKPAAVTIKGKEGKNGVSMMGIPPGRLEHLRI